MGAGAAAGSTLIGLEAARNAVLETGQANEQPFQKIAGVVRASSWTFQPASAAANRSLRRRREELKVHIDYHGGAFFSAPPASARS
jgi:hypothetical protein